MTPALFEVRRTLETKTMFDSSQISYYDDKTKINFNRIGEFRRI